MVRLDTMKLVLSSSQSSKFTDFHSQIQSDEKVYEYSGYKKLLFIISDSGVDFVTLNNGLHARDYEAVYLTSYLKNLEPALAAATVLNFLNIRYADKQLQFGVSTTKLTEYTKLAASGVSVPNTYAGYGSTLIHSHANGLIDIKYPAILKRADADRGVDNYKVSSPERAIEILESYDKDYIWVLQQFIPNNGFYRLSYYSGRLSGVVFRSSHERGDGNIEKAHLNKPSGGANAIDVEPSSLPLDLIKEVQLAYRVMRREFAGVDALIDSETGRSYILEVNYNPQLVTLKSSRDIRAEDFLQAMRDL